MVDDVLKEEKPRTMEKLDVAEISEKCLALVDRQFRHIQCSHLGACAESLQTLRHLPGLGVVEHKNEFLALLVAETGADDVEVLDFDALFDSVSRPIHFLRFMSVKNTSICFIVQAFASHSLCATPRTSSSTNHPSVEMRKTRPSVTGRCPDTSCAIGVF